MKQDKHQDQNQRSIQAIQEENVAFYEDLTSKNSEYFYKLRKALSSRGLADNDITQALNPLLKEAFEKQNQGQPARQLFGRVNERADLIAYGEITDDSPDQAVAFSPDWQLYVDGGLFVGGIFALISGVTASFSGDPSTSQLGLLSLIANFVIGGFVMLAITKTAPRPNQQNNYLKYFVASIGSIAAWAILSALINLYAPPAINPILPSSVCIIIGALALVGKWLFKRHYNVQGGVF